MLGFLSLLSVLLTISWSLQFLEDFNYIVNGDFQAEGSLNKWEQDPSNIIPGWKGGFQIGQSLQYNKAWRPISNVMQLDFGHSYYMPTQVLNLTKGTYLLKFKWAAYKRNVRSSRAAIYWNDQPTLSIRPVDANLHYEKCTVKAKQGLNQLKFSAYKNLNGRGITIDDVQLYRSLMQEQYRIKNTQSAVQKDQKYFLRQHIYRKKIEMKGDFNMIINGDFQYPKVEKYGYFSSLIGWSGSFLKFMSSREQQHNNGARWYSGAILKLVRGDLLNEVWKGYGQVIDLDLQMNQKIQQTIFMYTQTGFILNFKWAQSKNSAIKTNSLAIYWNGQLMDKFTAQDHELHDYTLLVYAHTGSSTLSIEGGGQGDDEGIAIDNVQLLENFIMNSGFEYFRIGAYPFVTNVTGWCCSMKIVLAKYQNSNFGAQSQAVELDSYRNIEITQSLYIGSGNYVLTFKYAPNQKAQLTSAQGFVSWNQQTLLHMKPTNYSIVTVSLTIKAVRGSNYLRFIGAGTSDGLGLLIDDVGVRRSL